MQVHGHSDAVTRVGQRVASGVARAAVVGLLTVLGGCTCRPELPPDPDPPPDTSATETGDSALDTAPLPPCAYPELEPNNAVTNANSLPNEQWACGRFDPVGDGDQWRFTLSEPGWVTIRVRSEETGSFADPMVIFTGDDGTLAERTDDEQSKDVSLAFPMAGLGGVVVLRDENLQGGPEFTYSVLVSASKPPLAWTASEPSAANDSAATAMRLTAGGALFGRIDAAADVDWVRVDLPPGRVDVRVKVVAFAEGSPANLQFQLLDAASAPLASCRAFQCAYRSGLLGWEKDPEATFSSAGDTSFYVRLSEEGSRGGGAYWYVLQVEAS